jgi:hypothetical protein
MYGREVSLAVLAALVGLSASVGEALAQASKEAVRLVPHRAVYEMGLEDTGQASGITGIDGRMVFEFGGSDCAGYTLKMRMVTMMSDSQGQSTMTDLRSSTWEQADGQRFRFESSQYVNDKLGDVTMGRAARTASDSKIKVRISQPSRAELDIPGGAMFPTQHSFALIDAANRGQKLLQAKIYDGSEKGQKFYDTTAFIGKRVAGGMETPLEEAAESGKLGTFASWPISIGYFETKSGDLTPTYQVNFRLYANGVSRELLIDYGDFSISGKLTSLEYLKDEPCQ